MATGTVSYWNGMSGWIKQTGVEDVPTSAANDRIFKADDVASGAVEVGATVTFAPDDDEPWMAYEVAVA